MKRTLTAPPKVLPFTIRFQQLRSSLQKTKFRFSLPLSLPPPIELKTNYSLYYAVHGVTDIIIRSSCMQDLNLPRPCLLNFRCTKADVNSVRLPVVVISLSQAFYAALNFNFLPLPSFRPSSKNLSATWGFFPLSLSPSFV